MKPRQKAQKGSKGIVRAAPGKLDAKQARRRVAKRGKGARAELIEHRVKCPVCGQMAKTHSVKPPELRPDALGRQPRAERRRLHELLSRRVVLVYPGKHPTTVALQHVVREECAAQGLRPNSLGFIARLDEATVRTLFECEGKCAADTLWRAIDALGLKPEAAFARAQTWLAERPRAQG